MSVDVDWRTRAACKNKTHLYFDTKYQAAASRVCAGCPVVEQCGNPTPPPKPRPAKREATISLLQRPDPPVVYTRTANATVARLDKARRHRRFILAAIIKHGPLTVDELHTMFGWSIHTIRHIVHELTEAGEIQRHRRQRLPYLYSR